MQFEGFYNINHIIVAWFVAHLHHLRFQPNHPNPRLHIPAFVPVFGVPDFRAGFLFRPDSGGIRPQHPWCSPFSTRRSPTSVADRRAFRSNLTGIRHTYMRGSWYPPYLRGKKNRTSTRITRIPTLPPSPKFGTNHPMVMTPPPLMQ